MIEDERVNNTQNDENDLDIRSSIYFVKDLIMPKINMIMLQFLAQE